MDGLVYQLQGTTWDWFGTLTFGLRKIPMDQPDLITGKCFRVVGATVPSTRKRFHMFYRWLREQESHWNQSRSQWILRHETGELNGRPHFHFLLRGLPVASTGRSARFAAMHSWEAVGGGFARIRKFSDADGISYVCKNLGANVYEAGKFAATEHTEEIRLSSALQEHLAVLSSRATV